MTMRDLRYSSGARLVGRGWGLGVSVFYEPPRQRTVLTGNWGLLERLSFPGICTVVVEKDRSFVGMGVVGSDEPTTLETPLYMLHVMNRMVPVCLGSGMSYIYKGEDPRAVF